MNKLLVALLSVLLVVAVSATVGQAASPCPDVDTAKEMLKKRQVAKADDIQAPRALAGARTEIQAPRGQEVQAPRSREVQAPRGQEVQAPRGQEVQAPRGQEVQAPRGQEVQAPRALAGAKAQPPSIAKARTLIKEAEVACKAGNTTVAAEKAKAAIQILK